METCTQGTDLGDEAAGLWVAVELLEHRPNSSTQRGENGRPGCDEAEPSVSAQRSRVTALELHHDLRLSRHFIGGGLFERVTLERSQPGEGRVVRDQNDRTRPENEVRRQVLAHAVVAAALNPADRLRD